MLRTSHRVLRLLSLLQSQRHWSGADLSQRLDVDPRTLRRDVDRLRELGYPIHASSGPGGGYALGAGSSLPPVLLEDDEAVAVAVALRTAAASVAQMEETAIGLLAKLDQWLPARLRRRASALYQVTVSLPCHHQALPVEDLTAIAVACRDGFRLRIDYADRQGKPSKRSIEPLRLAHSGSRWYLLAWDLQREDWRTFRVDRIGRLTTTGTRFAARAFPGDIAEYLSRSITQPPARHRARIRLHAAAETLAPQLPAWCGVLHAQDATHCLLETGIESAAELLAQLAFLGIEFELIDDGGLGDALVQAMARLQQGLSTTVSGP
jgi:predicted DNA-binding transcriptional regulator YafY